MRNNLQMLMVQRLLVYGFGLAVAIYAGYLAGSGGYRNLGLLVGGAVCLILMGMERFYLPVLIMLSMMPGRGVLLGGLGYWDAFALLVIGSVMLRKLTRKGMASRMVGKGTLAMVCVFSSIYIGHVAANFLGVGTGSAGGFQTALVAGATIMICYFILTESFTLTEMHRLPRMGVIPGMFEGSLELANYFWAAAIPITYMLYSNSLNWETLISIRTGGEVTRLAGLRALGVSLGLLCGVGIVFVPRLFSWRGMLVGLGLLCSFGLVLVAGYRSYVLSVVVAVVLAAVARSRLLLVVMVMGLMAVFGGLWAYNNTVAPLPLQIQRILCWLPGKWDPVTKHSANVGLEWRQEVWSRFMHTTFPQHPWFGQGIRHFPTEAEGRSLSDTELYAVTQRTHSGFFSALDHVGIVGALALVLASARAYWNCGFLLLARRKRMTAWMVWIILLYGSAQGWYWMTGDFKASFMPFALSMCLLEFIRKQVETPGVARQTGGGSVPQEAGMA